MAKKVILGTEIARDAFKIKVNDNFTELYNKDATLEGQINTLATYKGVVSSPDTLKKIEIVAGTIRQNAVDRTKWDIVSDSAHTPLGISATQFTASGGSITIPFKKTYSKVISFIAVPDETFANGHNMAVGASALLDSVILKASASIQGSGLIYYDGTNWVCSEGIGQEMIIGTPTFDTGLLSVLHKYCPGNGVMVSPSSRSGATVPYMPVIRAKSNVGFTISFINTTTGNFVTAADTKMAFEYTKIYNEGILLDGTAGSDSLKLDLGNIWFWGIFEV